MPRLPTFEEMMNNKGVVIEERRIDSMMDDPDRLMPVAGDAFVPRSKILYICKHNNVDVYIAVVAVIGPSRSGETFAVLPEDVDTPEKVKNWWNAPHA